MFQLLRFFPLGGWGGPEKDWILWHYLVHGLAITCHLVQVLLWGTFQGRVQVSLAVVWFAWSGILSWCEGQFRVGISLTLWLFFPLLQVRTQGMSGSSVLSKESWLGSAGCGLLTSAGSVVCFSSIHLLFLAGPSSSSTAFFLLAYCLPPTLCSHFLDIAR